MVPEKACPKCKSKNIISWCKRQTQNRGLIQRYKCKSCQATFTLDDGFFRMRNNPQKITCAIDLFYRGVSVRKVQEHFHAFYPHNSHFSNIYRWVVKYAKHIGKFTDRLNLTLGSEIQVDEIEYHRRKSHKAKRGVDENWFIDSIDTDTRFMVASSYCKHRGKNDIKAIMQEIKQKSVNQITMISTDGLNAYPNVIKKVFGYNNKIGQYNVVHNRNVAIKEEGFNYPVERMHNSIRQRTKTFRGFHGSVSSAYAIMKGFEIFYNFIREHQAIKCCPYELATNLKLSNPNKWVELIQLSCG